MNRFDQLTVELLLKARSASEYLPVRLHELAQQTGIEQKLICEKLVQLHARRLIKLSAFDEKEGREKPFDEWPSGDVFFNYASDGNYKRVRLLVDGAEFLEDLKQGEGQVAHAKIPTMASDIQEIIAGIDRLREEVKEFLNVRGDDGLPSEKLKAWTRRAYDQLKSWGFASEAEQGFGSTSITHMYSGVAVRAKGRDEKLQALRDDLATHPEHYSLKLSQAATPRSVHTTARPNKIFLGHGRNSLWARVQIYLKDELHLNVEAWESESRAGLHAIDVLKPILNSCTFAVIVATGEDSTASGEVRARQNVVHEIGLFQGRLGFEKVALLQQRGIEEFSNLAGLQVILFDEGHIEAALYDLGRMLKRERISP